MKRRFLFTVGLLAVFSSAALAGGPVKLALATVGETNAYVSGPEDAKNRVLIIHDYFGLSPSTMADAEWFGNHGFRTTAIDIYGGHLADTDAEAGALMKALDPAKAALTIHEALLALDAEKNPVVIIGFSMGGSIALQAQIANPTMVKAAAMVYGGGYEAIADDALKADTAPILVATGSMDAWAVPSMDALQKRMTGFGHPIETYVYPGVDHGFAQWHFNNGKNFDLHAALATRNVVANFVERAFGR